MRPEQPLSSNAEQHPPRQSSENMPREADVRPLPLEAENRIDPRREQQIFEGALETLQEVLAGFDRYALFGSTALFLRKHAEGEHSRLPEDLDLICEDEEALREVKNRLMRIPGIQMNLAPDGEFFSFAGQAHAKFFSGAIPVGNDYMPFECFSEKRIAGIDDVYRHRSRMHGGLMTLTGEGLKNQYLHTWEMDRRIDREVERTITRLLPFLNTPETDDALTQELEIKKEDLAWLREHLAKAPLSENFADPLFRQDAARRFSGIKTKAERREDSVKRLQNNPIKLAGTTETPPLKKAA